MVDNVKTTILEPQIKNIIFTSTLLLHLMLCPSVWPDGRPGVQWTVKY